VPNLLIESSISDNEIQNLGSYSKVEHSLNRDEHRVQIKAKFWKHGTELEVYGSVWSDVASDQKVE